MKRYGKKLKVVGGLMLCGMILLGNWTGFTVYAAEIEQGESTEIVEENTEGMEEATEVVEETTEVINDDPAGAEGADEEIDEKEIDKIELLVKQKRYNYSKKKIMITWEKISKEDLQDIVNVTGKKIFYRVYVQNGKKWKLVSEETKGSAQFTLGSYGERFCYKVEAFVKLSKNKEICVGDSGKITVCFPKGMSKIITTSTSTRKVRVSWDKVKGANVYQIEQQLSSGRLKMLKKVSGTSAKLDVEADGEYTFLIQPIFEKRENKIDIRGRKKKVLFENKQFVAMDHQKYSYKEMVADIKSLCKKYGEYISYECVGESEQGRQIYDVILGDKNAKNTVLVVSTLHSREYVATVTLMKQLEYYLQNYNKKIDGVIPAEVFENCCVHYVMMANPDGVTICQRGDSRRKTNANGVNLNCNFPYKLYLDKADLQKETQAIVDLTQTLNRKKNLFVVNYHAMGQIVFGDYSGKNHKLKSRITDMYKIAREATGYSDAGGYDNGSGRGNYREYLIYSLGVPSITIEVGDLSCPVPQRRYASIFKKNKYVVLREAGYVVEKMK